MKNPILVRVSELNEFLSGFYDEHYSELLGSSVSKEDIIKNAIMLAFISTAPEEYDVYQAINHPFTLAFKTAAETLKAKHLEGEAGDDHVIIDAALAMGVNEANAYPKFLTMMGGL